MKFPPFSLDDLIDFFLHEKLTDHIKSWHLHSQQCHKISGNSVQVILSYYLSFLQMILLIKMLLDSLADFLCWVTYVRLYQARNTLEHTAHRGKSNLPLHAGLYSTLLCGKQAGLPSCTVHSDPPVVSPSKWAKADHVAGLLLLRIYIWFGWGKYATIF